MGDALDYVQRCQAIVTQACQPLVNVLDLLSRFRRKFLRLQKRTVRGGRQKRDGGAEEVDRERVHEAEGTGLDEVQPLVYQRFKHLQLIGCQGIGMGAGEFVELPAGPAQVNESTDQIEQSLAVLKRKTSEQLIELSRESPIISAHSIDFGFTGVLVR